MNVRIVTGAYQQNFLDDRGCHFPPVAAALLCVSAIEVAAILTGSLAMSTDSLSRLGKATVVIYYAPVTSQISNIIQPAQTMETIVTISRFLPILSTIISACFAWVIFARYRRKPEAYQLLWWGIGVVTYGAGTLIESWNTLFGWSAPLFKAWYIAGALLGGAPLAIGSIYLLHGKRAGHVAVTVLLLVVGITSVFVILSPIRYELVDPHLLSSKVLEWQGIRRVSPFLNTAAFLFLVGGAAASAVRFFKDPAARNVSVGNIFIAIGALLPGIGGMGSRMGHTELLYIGEFIGVILIWIGYNFCLKPLPAMKVGAVVEA